MLLTYTVFNCSDSIGACTIVGDKRWAGPYGVVADFIAIGHCCLEYICTEDIEVCESWAETL